MLESIVGAVIGVCTLTLVVSVTVLAVSFAVIMVKEAFS